MKGIKTNRNELISDFNPFGLDKLVMIVAAVVSVALWLTESPVIWWIGAYAWLGLWTLEREAKVRAGVSHYHEERIVELERQIDGLKARLSQDRRSSAA
jgi:predicted ferric reductase